MTFEQETIGRIEKLIADGSWKEAVQLCEYELGMPYVDPAFEKQLWSYKQKAEDLLAENSEPAEMNLSLAQIRKLLQGDAADQMAAVQVLKERNLRRCTEIVQPYLNDPVSDPLVKGMMIEALALQGIGETCTVERNGRMVSFVPAQCLVPQENKALEQAFGWIDRWYGSDDPTMCRLCGQVLVSEAYEKLPEACGLKEARKTAAAAVEYVLTASGMEAKEALKIRRNLEKAEVK